MRLKPIEAAPEPTVEAVERTHRFGGRHAPSTPRHSVPRSFQRRPYCRASASPGRLSMVILHRLSAFQGIVSSHKHRENQVARLVAGPLECGGPPTFLGIYGDEPSPTGGNSGMRSVPRDRTPCPGYSLSNMIPRLLSLALACLAQVGIAEESFSPTEVIYGRPFGTALTRDVIQPKRANGQSANDTQTKSRP